MHQIKTLSNGVQICYEKLPFLRSVSIGIWVKNGSRYESIELNGISHFIEHLLFKGTKTRTAKNIAEEMDSIGGQINAFTSKEYTCYYTKTLDTHLYKALDILTDMFFNSNFDNKEIEKERNVILEEIAMYEDTPDDLCYELLNKKMFEGCSLAYPILGTKKSLDTFNHDTFVNYFSSVYTPENTIISIAGNFDEDEVFLKLEEYFSNYAKKGNYIKPEITNTYNQTKIIKAKDVEQLHLNLSFKGLATGLDKTYSLQLFSTIFGGGMSSVLFQKVREEKGLAYSVYTQNASYKDTGILSIYAGLNPDNIDEALKIIFEEVNNFKTNKVSEKLLNTTKEQMKSNFILSLESSASRMNNMGRSLITRNKILTPDEIIQKIDNVTIESINEVVNEVFDFNNLSMCGVGNVKGVDFDKVKY